MSKKCDAVGCNELRMFGSMLCKAHLVEFLLGKLYALTGKHYGPLPEEFVADPNAEYYVCPKAKDCDLDAHCPRQSIHEHSNGECEEDVICGAEAVPCVRCDKDGNFFDVRKVMVGPMEVEMDLPAPFWADRKTLPSDRWYDEKEVWVDNSGKNFSTAPHGTPEEWTCIGKIKKVLSGGGAEAARVILATEKKS